MFHRPPRHVLATHLLNPVQNPLLSKEKLLNIRQPSNFDFLIGLSTRRDGGALGSVDGFVLSVFSPRLLALVIGRCGDDLLDHGLRAVLLGGAIHYRYWQRNFLEDVSVD